MAFRLYNTFSKTEEDFVPADSNDVKMYTCGPTVYGRPHIGNYSSFLMADLLRRWMEAGHGWEVKHVKNITDVGHLVADADTGEDKIEKQATIIAKQKRGESAVVGMDDVLGVAQMYTDQYLEDEKALNLIEPFARPKATETIPEMIEIIKELVKRGHAYETEDGLYFSVESFPSYGRLSGNTVDKLNAGARVRVDEQKKHPADFALWKKLAGENAQHVLQWDSPWGKGFPGWHIECSAMAKKFLGETLDIHTGGEDNIFPHHECEIAQSECAASKPFVRLWLHKRRIDLAGEKMSKSLGNVLSIPDISAKGYSPLDIRYYFLSVHYRTNLKFAWKGMDDAKNARRSITEWIARGGAGESAPVLKAGQTAQTITADDVNAFAERFDEAMNNDLNTPGALAAVFDCMHKANAAGSFDAAAKKALAAFTEKIRHTFGCFEPEQQGSVPADVQKLIDERAAARAAKNFAESDRLRDAIAALGYEVKDTSKGQQLRRL